MPNQDEAQTVAIAGTFTVEPVAASIGFWMEELSIASRIEFASYNQVFQELLDPNSLLSTNHNGINVLLVRSADLLRYPGRASVGRELTLNVAREAQRNTTQLVKAVRQFAQRSRVPLLLVFCPNPSEVVVATELPAILAGSEQQTKDGLNDLSEVNVVTATELMSQYPVADFYDPYGDKSFHIPFTPVCFASIGTMVSRRIFRLRSAPFKVIVLDCDQTLWKGVCAEDGPLGVKLDYGRTRFQESMRSQHDAGMLLCLCSKNIPDDVLRVFENRPDMPLSTEHITASRFNWKSKSENLRSLAEELRLDLSSFVFIDDSPLECAEVRMNCPDVLTLQLPRDSDRIPEFLQHVWAFDRIRTTREDSQRGSFYRQNFERATAQQALGLREFFATLDLKVQISQMRAEELPRVAQLVERTNQFNMTTIRLSQVELGKLWQSGSYDFLTVQVEDRFGNYGLVGLTISSQEANTLVVNTFLLSCRALGRGVEHQMLAHLGKLAKERALDFVVVPYVETERNRPALDFFTSVTTEPPEKRSKMSCFRLRAERAVALTHPALDEDAHTSIRRSHSDASSPERLERQTATRAAVAVRRTEQLSCIAEELHAPKDIVAAIANWNRKYGTTAAGRSVSPERPLEKALAQIWSDVLGVEHPGLEDNFFALGGHSLAAVQITFKIREAFNVEFPLQTFLAAPVLGVQAQQLEERLLGQADASELEHLNNDVDTLG